MKAVHVGGIVLACLLVFSNALSNGFHLDDGYRIEGNPGVQQFASPLRHFTDPATSSHLPRIVQYRPLLPLSLSINYAIAGDSLVGYHIGNLLFQIIASVLVYFLVREILTHWTERALSPHTPWFIALMFAVHPVSGVPVNYLCSRDLLLMQLFMVGSLLAYVRMRRLGDSAPRWIACGLLLLCSLLAKKNAVVLPALIGLFELLFTKGAWHRVWRVLPFAAIIGAFLLFVRYGLGFSDVGNIVPGQMAWLEYGTHQLQHHVFHYVSNFIWPLPIRMDAADPIATWKVVVGGVCIAASWGLAAFWWRRRPVLTFGILGYQVLMVLTSSILPLHDEIVAYRPYPASVFFFLVAGVLMAGLLERASRGAPLVLGAIVIYFGAMSFDMNRVYKDEVSFNRHSVAHGAISRAHYNLANSLPDGHPEQFVNFDRALEISPGYIVAHLGRAMAELRMTRLRGGDITPGIERLRHAVRLDENRGQSHYYLALGLASYTTDTQGAAAAAVRASELNPRNAQYRSHAAKCCFDLAKALADKKTDNAGAADAAARASELDPRNAQYRYYAGERASVAMRFEAVTRFLAPIDRSTPGHRNTQFLLGYAYMSIENWPRAVQHFESCLKFYPMLDEIHLHLVKCYRAAGNQDEANRHQALHDEKSKKKK